MIKGWGLRWYYLGIFGTGALSLSLLFTRVPNGITSTALIDTNPMALLTEFYWIEYCSDGLTSSDGGGTSETIPDIASAGGGSEFDSKTKCLLSSLPNVPSSHFKKHLRL